MATIFDSEELDFDGEPPTNEDGEFICSRRCIDGTQCMANVSLACMACYQHDRSAPIVSEEKPSPAQQR